MPRIVDLGVTRLTWVPGEDAFADPAAPAVTELGTGVDLSTQTVTTYEVRTDGSETTNERSVAETANVVTPTIANYMGNLILFRQFDPDLQQWLGDDVLQYLQYQDLGWFVRRLGFAHDVAYAAAQQVETYKFMVDNPQIQGGTGAGYLKATVPLLQQGAYNLAAIVAA